MNDNFRFIIIEYDWVIIIMEYDRRTITIENGWRYSE